MLEILPVASQDEARKRVLERFAGLFERQVRMYQFVDSISDLVRATHAEIFGYLCESMSDIDSLEIPGNDKVRLNAITRQMMERFARLDSTLAILLAERVKQRGVDNADLKLVMQETNRAAIRLESTLIEKHVFERHSAVIESIFLSQDKVMHWRDHLLAILVEFQSVLSFDYLFFAHYENQILVISLFYLDHCPQEIRFRARRSLPAEVLSKLHLAPDTAWDIEEFSVAGSQIDCGGDSGGLPTITAPVQSLDASGTDGLLGIAYAPQQGGAQQMTLIRSILSVMVMVVGSSKTLSRTLSDLEYFSNHDPLTGLYNRR